MWNVSGGNAIIAHMFSNHIGRCAFLLGLLGLLGGCPLPPHPPTPYEPVKKIESSTARAYWLYLPSYYKEDREWPLVVSLHGTYGWDGAWAQAMEWKYVAEQHGLIVVAPQLKSVQGILPVIRSWWYKDLEADERLVLAIIDEMVGRYRVDPKAVLLTGFSAGGYPLYYVGLRNPKRFNMVIARACNSDVEMMDRIKVTDDLRKLPVTIFWGRDDMKSINTQSWEAFEWLRVHKCYVAKAKKVEGGHFRRPERAYEYWLEHLPKQHRA